MAHSIEVWRLVSATEPEERLNAQSAAELSPPPDAMDDSVVELSRRYPGLSRVLAEYLAR